MFYWLRILLIIEWCYCWFFICRYNSQIVDTILISSSILLYFFCSIDIKSIIILFFLKVWKRDSSRSSIITESTWICSNTKSKHLSTGDSSNISSIVESRITCTSSVISTGYIYNLNFRSNSQIVRKFSYETCSAIRVCCISNKSKVSLLVNIRD